MTHPVNNFDRLITISYENCITLEVAILEISICSFSSTRNELTIESKIAKILLKRQLDKTSEYTLLIMLVAWIYLEHFLSRIQGNTTITSRTRRREFTQ